MADPPPDQSAEPKKKREKKPTPPPDTRPLIERVHEHFERLCESDTTIKGLRRKIDACEETKANMNNLQVVARSGIRMREAGLMRAAYKIVQRETGIRTIPGFKGAHEDAQELRHASLARLKAAEEEARKTLPITEPLTPPTP